MLIKRLKIALIAIIWWLPFVGCATTKVVGDPRSGGALSMSEKIEKSGVRVATVLPTDKKLLNAMTKKKKITEPPKPPVPPNVAFVQSLQALLKDGQLAEALKSFDEMDESLKDDKDIGKLKASLLVSAGRAQDAVSEVRLLLQKFPGDLSLEELNIICVGAAGDYRTQDALVKALLKKVPTNPTANIVEGNRFVLGKKWKLARKSYFTALRGDSNNGEALAGYAQMCYYTGDLGAAKKSLEKLQTLEPDNPFSYQYMAKLSAEKEDYHSAANWVKKAIALDGTYDCYLDLGQYERLSGHNKEAEAAYTKAIEMNPKYFLGYAYRAGLRDETGRSKEALEDYNKVIETNPKYYFAFEEIGILEYHLGNFLRAYEFFQKAASIRANPSYYLMSVASLLKAGKTLEAKALSDKIMRGWDRSTLEYKTMRLFHDMGPANAEVALIRDVEREQNRTNRGRYMFYLALYHEIKGVSAVAEEYYEKVMALQAPMFFEWRFAEWASEAANG